MEIQTKTQVQHKFHHDDRPYAVASMETAAKAKKRFQAQFAHGQATLGAALQAVKNNVPEDALVPNDKIKFDFSQDALQLGYKNNWYGVHDHAYGQLLDKADIPRRYADLLHKDDPSLLLKNLRGRFHEGKVGKKYLSRVVNGEVRGWLSDMYCRFDVEHMAENFLDACMSFGAVPVKAKTLPTRFFLKMVLPIAYEPVENEVMVFGIQFRTSDFGDGAYELRGFLRRIWCTNDAMAEDCLRQVHLGPKLTAANFSQETLTKQAEMLASATRDTVKGMFKPSNIERKLAIIKAADEENIKIEAALDRLRKNKDLNKAESERVKEILTTSDVEVLPPVRGKPKKGQTTLYRFANAFSAFANDEDVDPRRAMDLEILSGRVLGLHQKTDTK